MDPIALWRRRVKSHHLSRAGLVAAGIAAALVFFVAGTAIRLLFGPVSLGPFAGSLADAIDRALPGITVKYDQAAVEWERDEGRKVPGATTPDRPETDTDFFAHPGRSATTARQTSRSTLTLPQCTRWRNPAANAPGRGRSGPS